MMSTSKLIECSLTLPPFSDVCCLEVRHLRVLQSSLAGLLNVDRSQVRRAKVGSPTVARSQVRRAIRWLANRSSRSGQASVRLEERAGFLRLPQGYGGISPMKRLSTDQVRTFQGLKALSSSIPFI